MKSNIKRDGAYVVLQELHKSGKLCSRHRSYKGVRSPRTKLKYNQGCTCHLVDRFIMDISNEVSFLYSAMGGYEDKGTRLSFDDAIAFRLTDPITGDYVKLDSGRSLDLLEHIYDYLITYGIV